jgi:hypothetical protein
MEELSTALEAERRRAELVTAALDHAQRRLDESNKKLQRLLQQAKERDKHAAVAHVGMSRAQVEV